MHMIDTVEIAIYIYIYTMVMLNNVIDNIIIVQCSATLAAIRYRRSVSY